MANSENHTIHFNEFTMVVESKQPNLVVITIPHDGLPRYEFDGFFQPRERGIKGRDKNVWPIAKDILLSRGLPDTKVHKFTSAVRNLLWRGIVDCNRAWPDGINYYPLTQLEAHTALDDPEALSIYRAYHDKVDYLIQKAIAYHGRERFLLIDLHGFSKQPPYTPVEGFDLILGTGNRQSIPYGEVDQALGDFLRTKGYRVFVPVNLQQGPVEDWYSADFTTRSYSSKYTVNALQIETAPWFRDAEMGKIRGPQLSEDLLQFLGTYFFPS